MNLRLLRKTLRPPGVGDIFVMQLPSDDYLYGRVIDTDANPLGVGGGILIYIYGVTSTTKHHVPELLRGRLLVPPMITNRQPWTKGYFELVEHRPLSLMDRLPQHSFKDSRGWFFDEKGHRLPGPVEPVGEWGVHSYRSIDDEISKALSVPLSD